MEREGIFIRCIIGANSTLKRVEFTEGVYNAIFMQLGTGTFGKIE